MTPELIERIVKTAVGNAVVKGVVSDHLAAIVAHAVAKAQETINTIQACHAKRLEIDNVRNEALQEVVSKENKVRSDCNHEWENITGSFSTDNYRECLICHLIDKN